jgi:zinc protease
MRRNIVLTLAGVLALCLGAAAQDVPVDIPYQKFVLPNGLTLLVHEDHKAPIVSVNIWYHVGSKNEKPGKTGFAHLFEHLMFNGSENFNADYFKVLEKLGATDLNGTTSNDRTNYFQNVPTSALDTVLWMESDRMGHLLGAVTQAKLDEQRGVVQNEKRQGENQPYGQAFGLIAANTYPPGHPYSWDVIGSMDDLNAASLEDVREWFRTYYGPSNAVLAVAGDIDAKTAREKVEKYFGWIPPGPPVARHQAWVAKRTGVHRQVLQDRVPQARIQMVWNTPQANTADSELLSLAAQVLGGSGGGFSGGGRGGRGGAGGTSRLFRRLVYTDQIATNVSAFQSAREIAGQFMISASVRPGVDSAKVEQAINEELKKFLDAGPAPEELERVKARAEAQFLRGVERIGGFGGKSDLLISGEVFAGNPEAYKISYRTRKNATAAEIQRVAREWLSDGVYILEVRPFPPFKASTTDVDRSKVPAPGPPPEAVLPKLERATLTNGVKVILAERRQVPVVNLELLFDAGSAADPSALPGTAQLTAQMLTAGTRRRNLFEIGDESDLLGAQVGSSATRDLSLVTLSALKAKLDASLELWADVLLNPAFDEQEFRRLQKQALAAILREKSQPASIAGELMARAAYGAQHPYGRPSSGTEASVGKLTRDDLAKLHQAWYKPNNATLVVVGDTTLAELTPKLEKLLAGWKRGDVPKKNVPPVPHQDRPAVYLVDRPGAPQSVVVAGHVAPPRNTPDEIAFEVLNTILGGAFTSRVNMNIREEKHWSYGARTAFQAARAQRLYYASAPVQSDKTRETMIELRKEFSEIAGSRPATPEEMEMARENRTLRIPGSRETGAQVLASIVELVNYQLPDDWYNTYSAKVRALTQRDVTAAAEKLIRPDKLIWVVVGDRAKVEAGIRELNYGELRVVDADGNPVR